MNSDVINVLSATSGDPEWMRCPICGNKTRTKMHKDTVLVKFPLFCRKCKNTILVNAQDGKITVIK